MTVCATQVGGSFVPTPANDPVKQAEDFDVTRCLKAAANVAHSAAERINDLATRVEQLASHLHGTTADLGNSKALQPNSTTGAVTVCTICDEAHNDLATAVGRAEAAINSL